MDIADFLLIDLFANLLSFTLTHTYRIESNHMMFTHGNLQEILQNIYFCS